MGEVINMNFYLNRALRRLTRLADGAGYLGMPQLQRLLTEIHQDVEDAQKCSSPPTTSTVVNTA